MSKKPNRAIAGAATICLVLSSTPAVPAVAAGTADLKGAGRVETAIKIAEASWNAAWSDSRNAILASGKDENLVDALAAAPLAYAKKAPILLSKERDALDTATLNEIRDRRIERVYIVAGEGVISDKIEAQLKNAGVQEVIRLGGVNRYETAKNINRELGDTKAIAVVNGETGIADALSISSIAASEGMAITLTENRDTVPNVDLNNKTVYAIGGNGVISDSTVARMNATRLGGVDRYETNAKVIEGLRPKLNFGKVYFSDGGNGHLVDTLTGAILAAQTKSPVVLMESGLHATQRDVLRGSMDKDSTIQPIGGINADFVSSEVNSMMNLNTSRSELTVDSAVPLNLKQVRITFNKVITRDEIREDIEDTSNYSLEDRDGSIMKNVVEAVKLEDGKKSAILTFKDRLNGTGNGYMIENNRKYTLTMSRNITGAVWNGDLYFNDGGFPKVEDIKVAGNNTIKVRFSEPIKPDNLKDMDQYNNETPALDNDDFEIDDGNTDIDRVELINSNQEANIILKDDLRDGQRVKVRVKNTIQDYAGIYTVDRLANLRAEEDEEEPKIVGYRSATDSKVTLIFDKEVRFKNTYQRMIDNNNDSDQLKKFYYMNEENRAQSVEIDGKEVTITFDPDDAILSGSNYVYIKANALENLWGKGNSYISEGIQRNAYNGEFTIAKIEKDSNSDSKINIKYSQPVKTGNFTERSAENENNYILKDSNGDEWNISSVEEVGDDSKSFTIETSKDLDEDLSYTLTVKNIENRAGTVINRVSKDFNFNTTPSDDGRSRLTEDDISGYIDDPGTSDQRIVIDFGRRMKTGDDSYAIDNEKRYRLISRDKDEIFDDQTYIDVEDMYNSSCRALDSGRKVEIKLPYKSGKDYSYDLSDKEINVRIGIVKDSSGDLTSSTFTLKLGEVSGSHSSHDDEHHRHRHENIRYAIAPGAISTDTIQFGFNDKVQFDSRDFVAVAAPDQATAEAAVRSGIQNAQQRGVDFDYSFVNGGLRVASYNSSTGSDGNTQVLMKFDNTYNANKYADPSKSHVFTYDGKLALTNEPVFIVVVPSLYGETTRTKNSRGDTVSLLTYKVQDRVGPAIIDNSILRNGYKFGNLNDNMDQAIQIYQPTTVDSNGTKHYSNEGALVLNFEEPIDPNTISASSFALGSDFKDTKIKDAYVDSKDPEKVILELASIKNGDKELAIGAGFKFLASGTIRDLVPWQSYGNFITGTSLQVGAFAPLDSDPRKNPGNTQVDDPALVKAVEDAVAKFQQTKKQEDKDLALKAVALLKDEVKKKVLNDQINAVVVQIDDPVIVKAAEDAVAKFIASKTLEDKAMAQQAVAALKDEAKKSDLNAKINAVIVQIDDPVLVKAAEDAVAKFVSTKIQADKDTAQRAVSMLKDETKKKVLNNQIDAVVVAPVDDPAVVHVAEEAVLKFAASRTEEDRTLAQKFISTLKVDSRKAVLNGIVDGITPGQAKAGWIQAPSVSGYFGFIKGTADTSMVKAIKVSCNGKEKMATLNADGTFSVDTREYNTGDLLVIRALDGNNSELNTVVMRL